MNPAVTSTRSKKFSLVTKSKALVGSNLNVTHNMKLVSQRLQNINYVTRNTKRDLGPTWLTGKVFDS